MSIETEILALREPEGDIAYKAETIVEWARKNTKSELHAHSAFLWGDDAKAAHEHRLGVARSLIRIHIRTDEGKRATYSLIQDRSNGGGYREITQVFSNEYLRKMAVRQALREAEAWRERYIYLKELAGVFAALDRVVEPASTPPPPPVKRSRPEQRPRA